MSHECVFQCPLNIISHCFSVSCGWLCIAECTAVRTVLGVVSALLKSLGWTKRSCWLSVFMDYPEDGNSTFCKMSEAVYRFTWCNILRTLSTCQTPCYEQEFYYFWCKVIAQVTLHIERRVLNFAGNLQLSVWYSVLHWVLNPMRLRWNLNVHTYIHMYIYIHTSFSAVPVC